MSSRLAGLLILLAALAAQGPIPGQVFPDGTRRSRPLWNGHPAYGPPSPTQPESVPADDQVPGRDNQKEPRPWWREYHTDEWFT